MHWVTNNENEYKLYIENRRQEIRKIVDPTSFNYCPTKENPADHTTRGLPLSKLAQNTLWLHGPKFLELPPDQRPKLKSELSAEEISQDSQELKQKQCAVNLISEQHHESLIDYTRFSSFYKVTRVIALVVKFIKKTRKIKAENEVSLSDLQEAENLIIKDVQREILSSERYAQLQKSLKLFCGENKILRSGGRLSQAPLECGAKFPIIMPGSHDVTKLIVRKCHETVGHNGVKDTLTQLRDKYWLVKGRQVIKKLIKNCVVCRKLEGQGYFKPPIPSLPELRLKDDFAFSHCGCDFCGPLFVKPIFVERDTDPNMYKVWICLFTCASSRGVHIDLVPDLTVGAFVRCLKRFVNRKGFPYLILSDNGKTFKGKELKEVLLKSGINWRFNLAKASWTGGFFERLIRSLKRVLKKLLRNARLTYEELLTVLSEVEGILNSRPLTYLDSENFEEPLTPSHLFLGKRLLREPEYVEMKEEIIVTTENLSRRAKYLQTLLSQFWSRWRREYLSELREAHSHVARSYKSTGERFIKQDDIVLISEGRVPPNTWRVGKVVSLIESKDGCVRGRCGDSALSQIGTCHK